MSAAGLFFFGMELAYKSGLLVSGPGYFVREVALLALTHWYVIIVATLAFGLSALARVLKVCIKAKYELNTVETRLARLKPA